MLSSNWRISGVIKVIAVRTSGAYITLKSSRAENKALGATEEAPTVPYDRLISGIFT